MYNIATMFCPGRVIAGLVLVKKFSGLFQQEVQYSMVQSFLTRVVTTG
jgi:hypothetical protein